MKSLLLRLGAHLKEASSLSKRLRELRLEVERYEDLLKNGQGLRQIQTESERFRRALDSWKKDADTALPGGRRNDILGVPVAVKQPNRRFFTEYCPDRAGLEVRYTGNRFSTQQPDGIWVEAAAGDLGPVFLERVIEPAVGDVLTILENECYDLEVGVLMVRVRHEESDTTGYITLETLTGETVPAGTSLWVADDNVALRAGVVARWNGIELYSTNRLSAENMRASREYLSRFGEGFSREDALSADVHPLQAGAHANRLGVWALDEGRPAAERSEAATLIGAMLDRYAQPAMTEVAPGAWSWPYRFEFAMPWRTRLVPPWYSAYASAAMISAAACAFQLTGEPRHREIIDKGMAFLRLPADAGGPLYRSGGYQFLAEYVYPSPPIPNYRVLDGEICSVVYVLTAAQLTADSDLLALANRLAAGLAVSLDFFCMRGGLPVFGMDAQPMNPGYMWQLWTTLQILANGFKDRQFASHARNWQRAVPPEPPSS